MTESFFQAFAVRDVDRNSAHQDGSAVFAEYGELADDRMINTIRLRKCLDRLQGLACRKGHLVIRFELGGGFRRKDLVIRLAAQFA